MVGEQKSDKKTRAVSRNDDRDEEPNERTRRSLKAGTLLKRGETRKTEGGEFESRDPSGGENL